MNALRSRIRRPVRREGAENYMLFTLLSFGLSVGLTRLFLELTGYPQLGNSELHIAHVLWGGLLLFVASLLPLIFANRWVYLAGAIFAGTGVGLFIDEVGKFITQTNDYFYPPAAPIIYAFFLLTVLLYVRIRRPPNRDARAELYRALDALEEVLDHDLDEQELVDLRERLRYIQERAKSANLARLARHLDEFLSGESLDIVPVESGWWERWKARLLRFERKWAHQGRVKAVLTGAMGGLSIVALIKLGRLAMAALDPVRLELLAAEMVAAGRIASAAGLGWFSARIALEGGVGLILSMATVFLLIGHEDRGIRLGYLGLLLSLTTVNLLVFFYDQFSTISAATFQFISLLGLLYYRRRFLARNDKGPVAKY